MAAPPPVPDPIYFADPSIPPIYGYVPYGKYNKQGQWVVTTPCQPSIIPMRAPNGQIFMTYEHPPGAQIKGKNNSESFMKQVTGLGKAVTGSVGRVAAAVGGAISYILK
jgi:hypothetical protein